MARFLAVLVLLVLTLSACGGDNTTTVTQTVAPESSAKSEPTPTLTDCGKLLSDDRASGDCTQEGINLSVSAAGRGTALGDLAIRIKSVRLAKGIPAGYDGAKPSRTQGRFVILRVNVRNRGTSPIDWSNLLDGRAQLLVGDKTFDHDGDAERNLPGALDDAGTSIPPDGSDDKSLVFAVTKPSVPNVRDGFLVFVTTTDLENGLDPSTARKVGLVRIPG